MITHDCDGETVYAEDEFDRDGNLFVVSRFLPRSAVVALRDHLTAVLGEDKAGDERSDRVARAAGEVVEGVRLKHALTEDTAAAAILAALADAFDDFAKLLERKEAL